MKQLILSSLILASSGAIAEELCIDDQCVELTPELRLQMERKVVEQATRTVMLKLMGTSDRNRIAKAGNIVALTHCSDDTCEVTTPIGDEGGGGDLGKKKPKPPKVPSQLTETLNSLSDALGDIGRELGARMLESFLETWKPVKLTATLEFANGETLTAEHDFASGTGRYRLGGGGAWTVVYVAPEEDTGKPPQDQH